MVKFNIFESEIHCLLNEESPFQKIVDALLPKKNPVKNYYPNIKGWGGLVNISLHDATIKVVDEIKKLRNSPLDRWVSKYDSPESHANDAGESIGEGLQINRRAQTPQETEAIRSRVKSFEQKAQETTEAQQARETQSQETKLPSDVKVVTGTDLLSDEGRSIYKIFRDKWPEFLDRVENAVVGMAQQRGSLSLYGMSSYEILAGRGRFSRRTGDIRLSGKQGVTTIDPRALSAFEENIMKPIFVDTKILIHCTHEQWDKISKGGYIYRGIMGAEKQIYSAGKNTPKVSL